ncbi:hypothetical protein [Micromonospora zhanjiangensis]|uniref:4-amino-4-deoxy-L-arabinose transferase n=1 Tax=Micromonospora zhanjiangensis TaxID=1522057 RepID=A0ABV8KTF2_9ACTN
MSVTVGSEPRTSPAAGRPATRSRITGWLPAFVLLVALVVVLVGTGTSWVDIARYVGYLGWSVLLPGTLVYRALRGRPHSLVDDLTMGAVVGLALEIVAYVGFSVADLRTVLPAWPLLVVVPFAAVPRLRRHWLPTGYRPAPPGWSWSVVTIALFLLGYLTVAFLGAHRPVPTDGPQAYFGDEPFTLALAGEAKHHFPLHEPSVAGEPLAYHWFSFAHLAVGSTIGGIDLPVVVFRLALPTLCVLAVVLLATVGWRISGRPWVGVVAAALTYAVGEVAGNSVAHTPLGGITAFVVWASQSVIYGAVITIALLFVVVDRLRDPAEGSPGRGGWWLLALLTFAASGAKSSVLPVLLAGVGVVCLVQVVRRRWARTPWIVAAVLLAGQVFALAVWYRFESQGLVVRPLGIFTQYANLAGDWPWWLRAGVFVAAFGAHLICVFPRLAGIPVLARLRSGDWGVTEWFMLGGLLGGVVLTWSLWHPGWGQYYFLRSAWPFGAILSAMGLVALIDRRRASPRTVAVLAVGVVSGSTALSLVAARFAPGAIATVLFVGLPLTVVAAVLLLAARYGRTRRHRPTLVLAALLLALGAGTPGLVVDAWRYPANSFWTTVIGPRQAEAARWLRAHSGPDDVVATNGHCLSPPPAPCRSQSFWLSGFAERRVLVESWAFATRTVRQGMRTGTDIATVPFWDPDLLATNQAVFVDPSERVVAVLRTRKVRWLVADRRYGRESVALGRFARLRLDNGDVAVYELPD